MLSGRGYLAEVASRPVERRGRADWLEGQEPRPGYTAAQKVKIIAGILGVFVILGIVLAFTVVDAVQDCRQDYHACMHPADPVKPADKK